MLVSQEKLANKMYSKLSCIHCPSFFLGGGKVVTFFKMLVLKGDVSQRGYKTHSPCIDCFICETKDSLLRLLSLQLFVQNKQLTF